MIKAKVLGIDIGTSAVKAVVVDNQGQVNARASFDHSLYSLQPGWAEEDPETWWQNTVAAIRSCLDQPGVEAESIAAVGVTGMVPALVLLDESNRPLRASVQQNDARAAAEIDEFQARLAPGEFFHLTGSALSSQSIGPKLAWLQRHEPDTWERARTCLGSYDYINLRLTGARNVERNWALESGLFDIQCGEWSQDLVRLFGSRPELHPPIVAPTDLVGTVSAAAAAETGLAAGTPVVGGSADHVAAALAVGIQADGDLLIKFGSAGDILYAADTCVVDQRLFIDYHDIPGKYLLNGCMSSSGSLLKWYVQEFCAADQLEAQRQGKEIYAYLDEQVDRVPPGSEGLVVLPYFLGEKTPIFDAHARGVLFGMGLHHTRLHVYRAILEAVVFGFRHHMDVLEERGLKIRRVVASEGGARSPLWRQIAADALGHEVVFMRHNPDAAFAAAFIAGRAVNIYPSWRLLQNFVQIGESALPNQALKPVYDLNYKIYRQVYQDLKNTFRLSASS